MCTYVHIFIQVASAEKNFQTCKDSQQSDLKKIKYDKKYVILV
jgi:hypothetical protein